MKLKQLWALRGVGWPDAGLELVHFRDSRPSRISRSRQNGSLHVVEHATGGLFFPVNSGQLTRVASDCSRTVVLAGLDRPTSVAIGPDGAISVTNHGIVAGLGEVLRIAAP